MNFTETACKNLAIPPKFKHFHPFGVVFLLKLFVFSNLVTLTGCTSDSGCVQNDLETFNISIERLEKKLSQFNSISDVKVFLDENKTLKENFLVSSQYPNDSILAAHLFSRLNNPHTDTLLMEVDRIFGEMADLKSDFEMAFSIFKSYYPDIPIPKIQTLITGFGSSEMYVSDSLIIIGLDFYLGPDAKYRPNGYPNYVLPRFQKAYILPAIILLLSDKYVNEDVDDNTMLADMIYYGKQYYFSSEILTCTSDSLLIWYSGQELEDVKENQDIIWANLVTNELLFETNHLIKRKYMGERPKVYEIGDKCPGRIGAWVGWEIVISYMNQNPDLTLQMLMENPDAKKIFQESRYKPKRPGLFN